MLAGVPLSMERGALCEPAVNNFAEGIWDSEVGLLVAMPRRWVGQQLGTLAPAGPAAGGHHHSATATDKNTWA